MAGVLFTIFDSEGDVIGLVDDVDAIPEWENALQRTAKQIAKSNGGWIEGPSGVVWDSQGELD